MSKLRCWFSLSCMAGFAFVSLLLSVPFLVTGRTQTLPTAALRSFPLSSPIPADPHELVTGAVQVPGTPAERAEALALLERARQNSDLHMPGTAPFALSVSFTAGGNANYVGAGELTETWHFGQDWQWTAHLGSYSQVRFNAGGAIGDEVPVSAVPMRVHMLRNAIFGRCEPHPMPESEPRRRSGTAALLLACSSTAKEP